MASDDAYSSFLDKANQDTGASASTKSNNKSASRTARKEDVHPAIAKVDAYLETESDEPFQPVSFAWDQDDLDESSFESLLSADADVSALTAKEFDPKSAYVNVLDAVQQASNAEPKIFRVDFGGTRLEYYVVGIDRKGGHVVGLKALAVES